MRSLVLDQHENTGSECLVQLIVDPERLPVGAQTDRDDRVLDGRPGRSGRIHHLDAMVCSALDAQDDDFGVDVPIADIGGMPRASPGGRTTPFQIRSSNRPTLRLLRRAFRSFPRARVHAQYRDRHGEYAASSPTFASRTDHVPYFDPPPRIHLGRAGRKSIARTRPASVDLAALGRRFSCLLTFLQTIGATSGRYAAAASVRARGRLSP
jgi:hypothetical protein